MRRRTLLLPVLIPPILMLAACTGGDDGGADDPGLPDDDLVEDIDAGPADDDENATDETPTDGTLAQVRSRGVLNCGINGQVPGFGFVTPEGTYEGFDVEFCQVVAAAVLGDADAVEYIELTAEARLTALQAREIDVLIRNTTWTALRDGAENVSFATTTFYDGQGMMVRTDDGFSSIADMQDTVVCTLSGTTTELNLESAFSAHGVDYEPLTFEDNDTLREAFLTDRCDGWTSDKSQLAAFKAEWPTDEGGPDALVVLDETMSKEPLSPATLDGDVEWFDTVNWAVIATIQAWEFGIDSTNVDEFLAVDPEENPDVARFLGIDDFNPGLGLDADFAVDILQQVGNYQEIYERTVGPDTALGLEPELNNLWTEGGLLYAPPYR
ncbi:amino acid ABC transporter substrate-binding protein [Phytoactinopolyspora limicola]|uniref:amino acid ABC transporter substrate-binding protein n=1 Tax=Phytoactinopolyspora limicola TaxID=2715536 RepID=UPI0014072DF4|nr:amino acid ABC transporter substrate-binding protein [Phytoactinopolyspora limicola]